MTIALQVGFDDSGDLAYAYVPAEGEILVKIFFRNLNFKEKPQDVAVELIKRGIVLDSNITVIRIAYQIFLEEELEKMKVKASDHHAMINVLLESLENMYEDTIKPQLQILIAKKTS